MAILIDESDLPPVVTRGRKRVVGIIDSRLPTQNVKSNVYGKRNGGIAGPGLVVAKARDRPRDHEPARIVGHIRDDVFSSQPLQANRIDSSQAVEELLAKDRACPAVLLSPEGLDALEIGIAEVEILMSDRWEGGGIFGSDNLFKPSNAVILESRYLVIGIGLGRNNSKAPVMREARCMDEVRVRSSETSGNGLREGLARLEDRSRLAP